MVGKNRQLEEKVTVLTSELSGLKDTFRELKRAQQASGSGSRPRPSMHHRHHRRAAPYVPAPPQPQTRDDNDDDNDDGSGNLGYDDRPHDYTDYFN